MNNESFSEIYSNQYQITKKLSSYCFFKKDQGLLKKCGFLKSYINRLCKEFEIIMRD